MLGRVDVDAEPAVQPAGRRLAERRACRSTAGSPARRRCRQRGDDRRRRRVARRADREVDAAARAAASATRLQLVEPVVGVRRRDEAHQRHAATYSRKRAEAGVVEAGPQAHAVVLRRLDEHLALAVHRGEHVAAVVRDQQLDDRR